MNDEVAVRVGDGVADVQKELQTILDRQRALVAVGVKMGAVDVLHDQVWLAAFIEPSVEHPGDVGVIERGEDVLLAGEAFYKERSGCVQGEHFQCGALNGASNDALDEVDGTDAAAA
jgi:hypothetical protein